MVFVGLHIQADRGVSCGLCRFLTRCRLVRVQEFTALPKGTELTQGRCERVCVCVCVCVCVRDSVNVYKATYLPEKEREKERKSEIDR